MITKMKKYTFVVYHRDYDMFLEQLRHAGVLHVSEKEEGVVDNQVLQDQLHSQQQLDSLIKAVEAWVPQGATLQSAPTSTDIDELTAAFRTMEAEKAQLEQSMQDLKKEQRRMQVWGEYSSEKINDLLNAGYELRYFSCSQSAYQPDWETLYNAFVVATEGGVVYFVTVGKTNESFDIEAEEVQLNKHNASQLATDIDAANHLLVAKNAQMEGWALSHLSTLKKAADDLRHSIDWTTVKLNTTSAAEDKLKLLEGFCPVERCDALNTMLDNEHIYYTVTEPTEDDHAPVLLRNNKFTKMFEVLTGMYGWPVYGEFDPTPILAPFFLLFFALCMGDAGYGILLILFGILTAKKKINISMFEGLGPIITTLGVGTLIVGFFLGTFFGIDLYTASWVPDSLKHVMLKGNIKGYDIQMVLALCIGVFHICLAMIVKAICYTKRFGFKKNISTWGWLLLILGGLVIAILALTEVFSPDVAKWALIIVGAVSALGIYVFNTPGRNPLINIGAGLWDTYNMATGILGDVLSYIRLYALGLAGGMLGGAFNNLAGMVLGDTPNIGTWIGFVLIIIVGHLLNLCMSALGAFVHPLRLTFVEYFKNSGYEGKGHLYKPFADD